MASGFNRIDCQKRNRIPGENAGNARNFNNNMQDLSPQTKAKKPAKISLWDFNIVCSITLSCSVLIESNYYIDIDLIKI